MADRIIIMNGGKIEQIGSPLDVYRTPATTFVAGFIGSPAMNLLPVTIGADGKTLTLAGGPALGDDQPAWGSARDGLLGVRPEALKIANSETTGLRFSGEVRLVEPLGAESLVHVALGADHELILRADGISTLEPGSTLTLTAPPEALHRFDKASGKRV